MGLLEIGLGAVALCVVVSLAGTFRAARGEALGERRAALAAHHVVPAFTIEELHPKRSSSANPFPLDSACLLCGGDL